MQHAGKASIKIDGDTLPTKDGATLDIGGVKRNTVIGGNKVLGYAEEPMPARVECEVFVGKGTSLERWRQVEDATITFETDTGNVYVLPNAWLTDPPALTEAKDGSTARLVFEAVDAKEIA